MALYRCHFFDKFSYFGTANHIICALCSSIRYSSASSNQSNSNEHPSSNDKDINSPVDASSAKIPVRYQVRATDQFFFGPLRETTAQRRQRQRMEVNCGMPCTSVDTIVKKNEEKKTRKETFNFTDYEKFAALYSKKDSWRPDTGIFEKSTCDQIIQEKRIQISEKLAQKLKKKKSSSKTDLKNSNKLGEQKEKSLKRKNTGKVISVSSSRYLNIPKQIDLNYIKNFPLYASNDDASENDTSQSDDIISVKYNSTGRKSLPSVSTILQATMSDKSKQVLMQWEQKMIALLGEIEFQKYKAGLLSEGHYLHQCIQDTVLHKKELSDAKLERVSGYWSSVRPVLQLIQEGQGLRAVESRITHPHLHYTGVVDCIANYNNIPVLIEWKTSSRLKKKLSATYDNPLQLAAYLGALQYDPNYSHLKKVQCCLLVLCYSFGSECDSFLLTRDDMAKYWGSWKKRLALYWTLMHQGKLQENAENL